MNKIIIALCIVALVSVISGHHIDSTTATICSSCTDGSCSDSKCQEITLGNCGQLTNACSGAAIGNVKIELDNSRDRYNISVYSDDKCTTLLNSYTPDCDTCVNALSSSYQCIESSSTQLTIGSLFLIIATIVAFFI
ncbi:hypothetical protein DLAC_09824 [Tieghemostelium lacteum]|uniref:Transmembrane protein n=1 Tax=Tieghemostelium lacteum TaxID=361077 RepID=A0A151Z7B0_TIELA|nr:hypothetical protein DLAC_09824 [Tieghemostelium lacteum]|eukprot:KYQ89849.1 hypothetical protein DLAC_09824 [Tieghemostelium lacteum]